MSRRVADFLAGMLTNRKRYLPVNGEGCIGKLDNAGGNVRWSSPDCCHRCIGDEAARGRRSGRRNSRWSSVSIVQVRIGWSTYHVHVFCGSSFAPRNTTKEKRTEATKKSMAQRRRPNLVPPFKESLQKAIDRSARFATSNDGHYDRVMTRLSPGPVIVTEFYRVFRPVRAGRRRRCRPFSIGF